MAKDTPPPPKDAAPATPVAGPPAAKPAAPPSFPATKPASSPPAAAAPKPAPAPLPLVQDDDEEDEPIDDESEVEEESIASQDHPELAAAKQRIKDMLKEQADATLFKQYIGQRPDGIRIRIARLVLREGVTVAIGKRDTQNTWRSTNNDKQPAEHTCTLMLHPVAGPVFVIEQRPGDARNGGRKDRPQVVSIHSVASWEEEA